MAHVGWDAPNVWGIVVVGIVVVVVVVAVAEATQPDPPAPLTGPAAPILFRLPPHPWPATTKTTTTKTTPTRVAREGEGDPKSQAAQNMHTPYLLSRPLVFHIGGFSRAASFFSMWGFLLPAGS